MKKTLLRRDLLRSAAAALSVAAVSGFGREGVPPGCRDDAPPADSGATRPAAVRHGPRTLKKAVMLGMIGEGADILEKFKILKDAGFDGVEMDSPTELSTEAILKAKEATGIAVHGVVDAVHWQMTLNNPNPLVRKKGIEALKTALRDAKAWGAGSVLLVPAIVNGDCAYDEAWRLSQEGIREALPVAEATGVKISVENVWNHFLLSPLEARQYIDDFKSPFVAWHMDLGNVINLGWPEQWIRILGKRIERLHIKDYSRRRRDKEGLWKGFDVELGDGDAGWAKIMRALDDLGYSTDPVGRWATAEVRGGDRKRLAEISAQMDKLFAQ